MPHESCVTKRELEESLRKFREDIYDEIGQKYNEAMERVHQTAPSTDKRLKDLETQWASAGWKLTTVMWGMLAMVVGLAFSAGTLYKQVDTNSKMISESLVIKDGNLINTKIDNLDKRQTKLEDGYETLNVKLDNVIRLLK